MGIYSISSSHNPFFSTLLSWYDITPGPEIPAWGIGSEKYSYYTCEGFEDQCRFYLLHQQMQEGLNSKKSTCWDDISDRTGNIKFAYKWHISDPWRTPEFYDKTFDDIVDEVAQEYARMDVEHFNILYSGGIDSSLVVISFIKNIDKNRFTICYTEKSILEYPELFEYLKKDGFKLHNLDINLTRLSDLPGIIVTGESGDLIFGNLQEFHIDQNMLFSPWKDILKKNGADDKQIDFVEKYYSIVPQYKERNRFIDLKSFHTLNAYWQGKFSHTLYYDDNLRLDKLYSFHKHKLFESWAFYNNNSYVQDSWKTYKWPAKKYIFSFTKDLSYYENKTKEYSRDLWKKYCFNTQGTTASLFYFIDYTGERITCDSLPFPDKDRFFEKYENRFDNYFK